MIVGRLGEGMEEAWGKDDASIAHRSAWPVYAGNGAQNSSTCYFEIDPGKRIGAHTHDCDETIVLLEGTGRGRVGNEETDIGPGVVFHVPENVVHDVTNTGDEILRLIGFFSNAEVRSTYEDVLLPDGTNRSGTPS